MAVGSCRVYAKYRFVTAPTLYQRMYTIFMSTIATVLYSLTIEVLLKLFCVADLIYNSVFGISVLHWILLIINIIHVRFLNSETNTKFFIKLQEVERIIKGDQNKILNDIMYRMNLATAALIVTVYIAFILFLYFNDINLGFLPIGLAYFQIVFLLELTCFTSLLIYFTIRIRFLNAIIINHLKPYTGPRLTYRIGIPTMSFLIKLAKETQDFVSRDVDVYLKDLIEGYSMFRGIYRFQVIKVYQVVTVNSLSIFDVSLAIFVCFCSEQFLRSVKATKLLCISLMAMYNEDGRLREKTRRMLKLLEDNPPNFSIYDMCYLDAQILIRMFSLSTTVFVTTLQFIYL
ncbi:uncharacterized protein ACR2FA_005122 [Aphomia sociella]